MLLTVARSAATIVVLVVSCHDSSRPPSPAQTAQQFRGHLVKLSSIAPCTAAASRQTPTQVSNTAGRRSEPRNSSQVVADDVRCRCRPAIE
jgi:hypothetical protein